MKTPEWAVWVKDRVDHRLQLFFAEKRKSAAALSTKGVALVEEIAELTMRGGKRLRPAVLFAGHRAVSPQGDPEVTADAAAALELLQTYLLVHDDWMDQDDVRRGGPSLHAKFRDRHADEHLGASLAIVAGDLAAGFSWELLTAAPFPAARLREGFRIYWAMHEEVMLGQHLDLIGHWDVELTHSLKTASYTVRGPLRLGALLGDAGTEQLEQLDRFGRPLGVAFQLRDDLLDAFGDRRVVDKPTGSDLRGGKLSSLVPEARKLLGEDDRKTLDSVLGNRQATAEQEAEAIGLIQACGARQRVEDRLEQLLRTSREALSNTALSPEGIAMLNELVEMLGHREW